MPPQGGVGTVRRARLNSQWNRLLQLPVATVTGAGGYGKTTLLLAWLEALAGEAHTAWLTLVAHEATLTELVEGVVLACARAFPDFGGTVRGLLNERMEDPRAYARAVANELYVLTEESGAHLVLFVDDADAAIDDEGAVAFLTALLQSLPLRVHVAFGSRRRLSFAPLAKLRNVGRLLEIGEDDLRFRPEEAEEMVADRALADVLIARTEGWAIAVHLTATLAKERVLALNGAFPAAGEAVFPFLAEEVVAALDPDVREMLGALAVPAMLDETTVNYLLERSDGLAILARLAERALYLRQADDGAWHLHQLFRDFLLARMKREQPEREREVRRRYAALLRERGDKLGALEQVIEAGDLVEIVEYVQEAIVAIRFTDRYRRLLELLALVPEEAYRRKPMLYRLRASALQRAGRWEDADAQLRAGYESARHNGDDRTACVALLERGVALGTFRFRMHGGHSESEACFREALALADGPSLRARPNFRQLSYEVLGLVHALRFEYEEAFRWFAQAERLELAASSHAELLFVEIARVYGWIGDWRRSLEYAELAEEFFRADYPFHVGYALLVVSKALIMLGEDGERAVASCREAVEALRSSFEDEELGVAYTVLAEALLASADADFAEVIEACDAAERFVDVRNAPSRCEIALLRAKVALRGGDEPGWTDAIGRAARLARGDRWLTARIDLERAWFAHARGEDRKALEGFDRALASFGEMQDRYHHAIARVGRDAQSARARTLDEAEARALLEELTSQGAAYAVVRYGPAAREILHWCLGRGIDVRAVQSLYERLDAVDTEALVAIARDARAAPSGRACALRLLAAREGVGADHRPLLHELSTDPQAQVAAAAANLLETLPEHVISPLRISAIAGLSVSSRDAEIQEGDARWGRRKAAELLRLLAVAGAPLTKGAVLGALWPDADKGRDVTLRVVIHALRRALQPASDNSSEYVVYDGTTIALRRSNVEWIDSESALGDLQRGKHFASVGAFDTAAPLLEEACERLGEAPKEEAAPVWLQPHVRRWRAARLDGLQSLAAVYAAQQRYDDALATVRRALSLDALDEATVCLALELLGKTASFAEGHALYAAYKRRLADALGAAPGAAVVERYSRLLSGRAEHQRTELSSREIEILRLVARGQTSKEIAHALALSAFTINNHVGRILKKLGVESRAAAVAYLHTNHTNEDSAR